MTTRGSNPDKVAVKSSMSTPFPIPTCHVAGHSLARCGHEWIDTAIHCMPDAPRVRVRFASTEFFDLLRSFPNLLTLTGISRNLQLALGGTVYEIHE